MPNYAKKIVYLSESQYQELITNQTITVNGVTIDYDENTIYMTPQNTPLYATDLADWAKAANKPTYTAQEVGALPANTVIPTVPVQDVQVDGVSVLSGGVANVPMASESNPGAVIVGNGLFVNTANKLTINTPGLTTIKAGTENYRPVVPGHQHESAFYGLAKAAGDTTQSQSSNEVGTYTDTAKFAIRTMLGAASSNVIAVQDTQPTDADTKIWLPETAETPVQVPTVAEMNTALAEKVGDVQVNGTSIVQNGVANVPVAGTTTLGVAKITPTFGLTMRTGDYVQIYYADSATIKDGSTTNGATYRPVTPRCQHESTFYGLAKAAGHDEASSTEPVGTYTPEAKGAIQSMLGVSDLIAPAENNLVASRAYAIGDVFTANGKLYKATAAIAENATIIVQNEGESVSGANAVEVQIEGTFVKNTDIASSAAAGVVKINPGYGIYLYEDQLRIYRPTDSQIKAGNNNTCPITPSQQDISTFYGLAKAAGDSTQAASDNAVGTYTDDAKAAIRTMLGAVGDVQVDGTSVISNGVANIPICSSSTFGVIKTEPSFGITVNNSGKLYTNIANTNEMKAGSQAYKPIVPATQHTSVFYGLAKAAGDTTMSSSSNAVGTYTDNAKASIKSMLGIVDGSTGIVDVSGAAPTITAVENTRYVCGEVTSLTLTPPASGICIVRFTSGSSQTLLTLPSTVKFPEWFDPTALETNTIYEICITDGIYGAVMSWAQ